MLLPFRCRTDLSLLEWKSPDTKSICVIPEQLQTMKRRLLKRFVKKITAHLRRKKTQELQQSSFQEKGMNGRMAVLNRDLHPKSEQIYDDAFCSDSVTSSTSSVAVAVTVERCTSSSPAGHTKPMLSSDSGIGDLDGEWWNEEEVEEEEEDAFLALEDWTIAASEMSLEKVVAQTKAETLYSGYWHGSVVVHARRSQDAETAHSILMEANTLSHIRHENIQLFLGICSDLQSDYYTSIVMDQLKGESLNTLLHRQGHKFNFQAVTKIMSQIAQGMEYLHAKGISHPLLTSRSVTIHYRVCISMLSPCGASSGSLEAGDLIYLPPEEMKTVCAQEGRLFRPKPRQRDFATNVFSFGTLVYEMVTMSRPFSGTEGHALIWQVSNGRCSSLEKVQEGRLKDVVQGCWQKEPDKRPSFEDLLWTIEQNMSPRSCGLKSHFSFSEPSQLAKLGL